jgi:anthranilate phosphoribosyltransferase
MFSWTETLETIVDGGDLDREAARVAMAEIMSGEASPVRVAAFLAGLRAKGETADEMTGFVDAMFEAAVTVDVGIPVVDLVGTGGDGYGTFNISTTAALVAAGAGVKIAKHGNRAASSRTGSADLLEALGVDLDMTPQRTVEMIREVGFGFFFAPNYHPAMRFAGPVRKELGLRTVFNFLGPLCNPAGASLATIGVSVPEMADKMIRVLKNRGLDYAFVYYGEEGLDEMSIAGPSFIYRLQRGEITTAEFTPEDFGVTRSPIDSIIGGDADTNLAITLDVLDGTPGAHRDATIINAAPAIVVSGLAEGFVDAAALAAQAIDSGAARAVVENIRTFSAA